MPGSGGQVGDAARAPVDRRVVRVLPDQAAIDKTFDYVVPDAWRADGRAAGLHVGSRVRVVLHGRRVGGWVLELDAEPPPGVTLRPLATASGLGPPAEVIDLARWAAWRWAGRLATFLTSASPATVVRALPGAAAAPPPPPPQDLGGRLAAAALAPADVGEPPTVVRLPPGVDDFGLVLEATRSGNALVVAPTIERARRLATGLGRSGTPVALLPGGWARSAAGTTTIGARAAAWAPIVDVGVVVVLDEHDEGHQEERAPTWNARDVAVERARRAGVPCLLVSPCPSPEALAAGRLLAPGRQEERDGWPIVEIIDRRGDDPRSGLLSERLTPWVRGSGPVVCVLNRTGRSRLLACGACGELARCEQHGHALHQDDRGELVCPEGDGRRPVVCAACGSTRMKNLRAGVARVREELEALAGRPVAEVTGRTGPLPEAPVYVGTEAVLHRVPSAATVVFLDLDQELLAPRYRAADQAMALLARAARLLGGRAAGGRLVLQTRQPRHDVVLAALHADPARLVAGEVERRRVLGRPPFSAEAEVSGPAAPAYIERLGSPLGVQVRGPVDGRWLLRAPDHTTLCDALAAIDRPAGRLRVSVDPLRT